MMRLHFSAADLARVRVGPPAGPFAETVLGLAASRSADRGAAEYAPIRGWLVAARRRLLVRDAEIARVINPCVDVVVDTFTLTGPTETVAEARSNLASAPATALAIELNRTCMSRWPDWLDGLDEGDSGAAERLISGIERGHARLVEPYWPMMSAILDGYREQLVRKVGEEGVDGLLAGLGGDATWQTPVLELPRAAGWSETAVDARLRGRGLVLTPVLLGRHPVPYFPIDPSEPAVLLVPVPFGATSFELGPLDRRGRATQRSHNGSGSGAALLGETRAAVLSLVADMVAGSSTTDVARTVGVAVSTASEHLTVLREAGLVVSARQANRVVHRCTPLGRRLVRTGVRAG